MSESSQESTPVSNVVRMEDYIVSLAIPMREKYNALREKAQKSPPRLAGRFDKEADDVAERGRALASHLRFLRGQKPKPAAEAIQPPTPIGMFGAPPPVKLTLSTPTQK